ncbi:ABC transporter ATP-binding protein [Roseivivax sediminis]|uniref:Spermidine/putrescine transport system ATP-binding protein n=1 Tax=Roseivivax sediminis TaxID=936889 RepID=A0A1I1V6E1_9RHOB|nr:ABC transporter ATP-binding protein [Roseivivax sediminis]SFD78484.1 spermidine/putrescine transport system ATP-binding protein [Roseivivax sediminis]
MAIAIGIDGVSKRYGDVQALGQVSLDIRAGEFFTLLGSSGCGKSTLLKLIGGFEAPDTGRLTFDGTDMARVPASRRPVNTVFQDLALFPHMSVGENVGYGLKLRGTAATERRRRVADALELVALGGFEDRDVSLMSGGQRQRVALARALIMEPGILLLDEPLTGLDERLRQQLRDEFGRLHKRTGATFVLVTHNQDEALTLSDRMAIMHQGRIVQTDTAEGFFSAPANGFVAQFLGLEPLLVPERVEDGRAIVAGQPIPVGEARPGAARPVVALRPDRLRLDASGTLELKVETVRFRGLSCDLRLSFSDGQTLTLSAPPEARHDHAVGQIVRIALAPDAALLIPPDDTATAGAQPAP